MRLLKWICEGKYIWLYIFIIFLIFPIIKIPLGVEKQLIIKSYGLILQLIGTLTIVASLGTKLFLFNKHGITRLLKEYFKSFPWPYKSINNDVQANVDSIKLKFEINGVRPKVEPKHNFEDIIKFINQEINYLESKIFQENEKNHKEIKELKSNFIDLKSSNDNKIEQNKKLILDSSISNIWLDLFGIGLIILGLVLATIPEIIIKYI